MLRKSYDKCAHARAASLLILYIEMGKDMNTQFVFLVLAKHKNHTRLLSPSRLCERSVLRAYTNANVATFAFVFKMVQRSQQDRRLSSYAGVLTVMERLSFLAPRSTSCDGCK